MKWTHSRLRNILWKNQSLVCAEHRFCYWNSGKHRAKEKFHPSFGLSLDVVAVFFLKTLCGLSYERPNYLFMVALQRMPMKRPNWNGFFLYWLSQFRLDSVLLFVRFSTQTLLHTFCLCAVVCVCVCAALYEWKGKRSLHLGCSSLVIWFCF